MAQTIPTTLAALPILGLDSSKPAEFLTAQFSPDNANMRVIRDVLVKRDGITVYGEQAEGTDKAVLAGREFERAGTRYNVRVCQDKVERYIGGTWADITGSDLTGDSDAMVATAIPLLSGQRTFVFTNGIDNIRKWTGTGNTADLGGSPPKARYAIEYKTYLVIAYINDGTVRSQRVQWTNTDDIEDWTGGNSGAIDLIEDGDDITGLSTYGDYLCVHKRNAIYLGSLVSNNSIFNFQKIPTQVGTVANNTIRNLQTGEQAFLGSSGIYLFNGNSALRMDDTANDEIADTLNPATIHRAWATTVRERNEVWFGIPVDGDEQPNDIYRFNYIDRTIFKDTYTNMSSSWRFTQTSGVPWDSAVGTWDAQTRLWNENDLAESFPLVGLSDSSGYTYFVDATAKDDNAVAVDAYWISKDFQADNIGTVVRWQLMQLWAKGNNVDVDYSTDEGSSWTAISTVSLGSDYPSFDSPDYAYFDVISSKIRFRFRNNTSAESFTLKQFSLGFVQREQR